MKTTLHKLRQLQGELRAIGAAPITVSGRQPATTLDVGYDDNVLEDIALFVAIIEEPEIEEVSRDLFASGHYNLAVSEAFKALDNFVARKVAQKKQSGTPLMESVFSPIKPRLKLGDQSTKSGDDSQKGYHRLFAGAMLGIRNPATHERDWFNDPLEALELIILAQHLLKKAKSAELVS